MPIDPKALADHLNGIADDPNGYVSIAEAKSLAALITELSGKLRVAREAIEEAEHQGSCGARHCGGCGYTWVLCLCSNIGNTYNPRECNCWKSRTLSALDATQPEAPKYSS